MAHCLVKTKQEPFKYLYYEKVTDYFKCRYLF